MAKSVIRTILSWGGKVLPFCLFTFLLLSCGGDKGKFKIEGSFRGMNQGELYIYDMGGAHKLDTIGLARGEVNYQVALDEPATFVIVFPNFSELPVFAEPGATIKISGDATHLKETEIKGTKTNKEMTAFRLQTSNMTPPEYNQAVVQYIKEHPTSPISLYLLNRNFIQTEVPDFRQARELTEIMSQAMPDNKQIASLAEQLSGLQSLKDGEKMPHFNATDINGKHVSLADMNAKVNVIMLWASWNYESVNLLNQIHRMTTHYGENLKVITVSIDANIKDCRRIAERDSLKWSTVCDGLMWESPMIRKTGLSYLPDNVVFDSQGKILGHSLNYQELVRKLDENIK